MLRRHTAVTRASCRAGALCHGAHSACVLALSRATGDTVIQYGDTECDTVIHIR